MNFSRFAGMVCFACMALLKLQAQESNIQTFNIQWAAEPEELMFGNQNYWYYTFEGYQFDEQNPTLPYLAFQMPVFQKGTIEVQVLDVTYESVDINPLEQDDRVLSDNLDFKTLVTQDRNQFFAEVKFTPIRKVGNNYERVVNIQLRIRLNPSFQVSVRTPNDVTTSKLSDGSLYKISTDKAGIHRITYSFLTEELGLDLSQVDPRQIMLLGDRGGHLPYDVSTPILEDIAEIPILIVGEEDGRFDQQDYMLFYGEGPDLWQYDAANQQFEFENNIYDDKNYYILKIGNENGLRVQTNSDIPGPADYTSTSFDDFDRFEEDDRNVMHDWFKTQGSGQYWFGDHFKNLRFYNYDNLFSFPGLITEEPIRVQARMALRALSRSSFTLEMNENGQILESNQAAFVSELSGSRDTEIDYAHFANISETVPASGPDLAFEINYPPPANNDGSEGWLDYIQVNVRRNLELFGSQTTFRDLRSLEYLNTKYQIKNVNDNVLLWEITNPLLPSAYTFNLVGNQLDFTAPSNALRTYVVFNPETINLTPEAAEVIPNQNLHGITQTDMLVVYHPDFEAETQRFAQHRSSHSGLDVTAVSIDQIMNEFAAGAMDPTAIRNFTKLLYERSEGFEYLLLFGDGSFDPRNAYGLGNNFIPTFQRNSLNPLYAFPSDDFFAILESNSEQNPLNGRLSISVGRLPVNKAEEAAAVIDKIISYDKNPQSFADWRNRLVFIADDEDRSEHLDFADAIADDTYQQNNFFNLEKIYLDAFPQVNTPGGSRFPAVNEAIDQAIFKGALLFTYLGHGGPNGLAQERILDIPSIKNWQNSDALTIFLTATCSFAGYDDVSFTTAGEELFLNPKGGAVALLTTTRAVFSSQNADLTRKALEELFSRGANGLPTMGEAMRKAKNRISFASTNTRKFTLIGDPSQKPATPSYQIRTETINGKQVTTNTVDTLNALDKVTIEGVVLDNQGNVYDGFNGEIFPTVYDKPTISTTLAQDDRSFKREYTVQKNVLFKGRSTVQNGRFKFSYVVPKDINYTFGAGKISYYAAAAQNLQDAGGAFEQIIIGGTNEEGISDNQGPQVDVYMNTEDFVFGGITDQNPVLLVRLEDENGINVVGNSIGHDLEGKIDDNSQNTLQLNDFYEAEKDDYTKGVVRYPLQDLAIGRHTIEIKAWDVANNSSTGYTEFVVTDSEQLALSNVLNFPNPFTDRTCFQFDHNLAALDLDVYIQIFTVSGRLVKTISTTVFSDGAIRQDDCIEWDGRDDFGDPLARGVYLFKVKVSTSGLQELSQESDFEKLVILK